MPIREFVNQNQTPLERSSKYHFVRGCGYSRNVATRLKDWTYGHIILFLWSNSDLNPNKGGTNEKNN